MTAAAVAQLEKVSHAYGATRALDSVSLEIASNRII